MDFVGLTMTWRCSAGVVSLSLTPRVNVTSPVSLSIRKRPSSSPSMSINVHMKNVHMKTQHILDINLHQYMCIYIDVYVVPERMA